MTLLVPADAQEGPPSIALEHVLDRYAAPLARLASAYARNRAERDDLLQDIALALLVALPRFRHECPERAFVLRVAHNRALALVTKRRVTATEPLDDDVVDHAPTAHDTVELRQKRRALVLALRALPVSQRQVLLLSLEGLSLDDVGAALGVNANAAGVRLHRARAALAALMNPRPPGDAR